MRPLPLWVYGATLAFAVLLSMCGCAAAPAADPPPQVILLRQFFLVPVQPDTFESCGGIEGCWYEPPADTDYGPI